MQSTISKPTHSATATNKKKYTIYVLQLQHSRYYVGRIERQKLAQRIKQHKDGSGSAWTRLFKVVRQCTQLYQQTNNPYDEDRKVKQMMATKGLNKVRGGAYSQTIDLNPQQVKFITREIYGSTNKCFRCGKYGHWVKQCKLNNQGNKNIANKQNKQTNQTNKNTQDSILNNSKQDNKNIQNISNQEKNKEQQAKKEDKYFYLPKCSKCNAYGHYSNQCDIISFSPELRNNYKKFVKCWNCYKFGHFENQCPYHQNQSQIDSFSQDFSSYSHSNSFESSNEEFEESPEYQSRGTRYYCYECHSPNHFRNECPLLNNQRRQRQSSSRPGVCNFCKQPGHWYNQCWKRLKRQNNNFKRNYSQSQDNSF